MRSEVRFTITKMSVVLSGESGMEGPLSKWTNVMKGWQYRWFVSDHQTGLLSYYTSKEKMMRGSRRGCVRLRGAVIGIDDEDDSTFTITCDQKTFHFQARNAEEREQWVNALEETILKHSLPIKFGAPSPKPIPTVQEFDRKLAEADAYLQILIEQVGTLESRIDAFEDETQHQKHDSLRDAAKAMIESIKQAIVLLQLAKNTLNPVNGLIQPEVEGLTQDDNQEVTRLSEGLQDRVSLAGSIASVDSALECLESNTISSVTVSGSSQDTDRVTVPGTNRPRSLAEQIPALSYSSSDDDFFDADEFQDEMSPVQTKNAPGQADGNMAAKDEFLCMADSDDEVLDCQEHGSVITHLLSQVRLGMDLTRVVLPTFILERRSLLEMYADFFAHPQLFSTISRLDNPKDRMLQVVKWYVSAFHAGRKGSVAKKPYNPILGETFLCHWDLDETETDGTGQTNTAHQRLIKDGPVPGATPDQVTFLAEQVSHHPPISAFYAEHVRNRMSFNAHIWTKSKFLGLSIGVEMVGQACVSDLIHEEEYLITFPNGYGRSILTIPWFEMGGKCNISCTKTGYSAQVVFHTKPFYGGKRNRISVEVQHVSDRRPFLTMQGEWNGVMLSKALDQQEEQVFIDTNAMKINKKKVRPLDKQGEYESRRLWKDVTRNLKIKDIDKATDSKHFLEERQRQEARERKEFSLQWETKLFHEDGECWIYDNPLQRRIDIQAENERQSSSKTTTPSNTGNSGSTPSRSIGGAGDGTTILAKTAQQGVQDPLS